MLARPNSPLSFLALLAGAILAFSLREGTSSPSFASDPGGGSVRFALGDEFWRRLERVTSIYWVEVPLREGLLNLGRTHGIAIVVDRRCVADTPVTLTIQNQPLRDLLSELANKSGYSLGFLPPVVYVGPHEAATYLEIIAAHRRAELKNLGQVGKSGLRVAPASWPRLSTPRRLVLGWAQEAGWRVVNLDDIPHDLWPEATLPPTTLCDRLTLVLIQFGLDFRVNPTGDMAIVPLTKPEGEIQRFRIGGEAAILAQRWQQERPDCYVVACGPDVVVQGPRQALEELSALAASVASGRVGRPSSGGQNFTASNIPPQDPFERQRFTVREGRGTLEGVIMQLARQLGLEIEFDQEAAKRAGIGLNQSIQFQVTNATVDELWRAVLEPYGLTFVRRGRQMSIFPANQANSR